MAKSHASDNPSFNKPLHRSIGNENDATGKFMVVPAKASSKGNAAVSRFIATAKKEGKKR